MTINPAMPPLSPEAGAPAFVASATEISPAVPGPTALMHDAIHANVPALPEGFQNAGYTTGTADIKWTEADWSKYPEAVRICQDNTASDTTADVLDIESGAASPAECGAWARAAAANYLTGKRIGQRAPVIYMSADNVTNVVNALIGAGITSGIGLWVANYNLSETEAESMVADGSGPFPVVGVQYTDNPPHGTFDTSVMSAKWLAGRVSHSMWLRLSNIPFDSPVYYNKNAGTLGYTNTAGKWTKVALP